METNQAGIGNLNGGFFDAALAAHFDSFTQYVTQRCYSAHSLSSYQTSVAHFALWLKRYRIEVSTIDEVLATRFVDHHLPQCNRAGLVRRTRNDVPVRAVSASCLFQ